MNLHDAGHENAFVVIANLFFISGAIRKGAPVKPAYVGGPASGDRPYECLDL